ncbi:MAG: DUF4197 domain-containing protein, partial [Nitrospinota bacterium]
MKRFCILAIFFLQTLPAHAGIFDSIMETIQKPAPTESNLSTESIVSGLKEALTVGTQNAIGSLAQENGYLNNKEITIPMPPAISNISETLKRAGQGDIVDNFIKSMNGAAETAAPKAQNIILDAIANMNINDAQRILKGGNTAATDYLKEKTYDKISNAFQPTISASLDKVGGTANFKQMLDIFNALPFMQSKPFNLDQYVTGEALNGLFTMMGNEETKIRTDPTARAT